MFVLCGQAALIPSRQLDVVWELECQQVKRLDELHPCLVLVLSLDSKFMVSGHWLLVWLTFPCPTGHWCGLCLDEGTHSFQEEALIPESVGPGFLLFALRTQSSRSPSSSLAAVFSCYQDF